MSSYDDTLSQTGGGGAVPLTRVLLAAVQETLGVRLRPAAEAEAELRTSASAKRVAALPRNVLHEAAQLDAVAPLLRSVAPASAEAAEAA